jgi:early secretory antigenic target protein ESAT-6
MSAQVWNFPAIKAAVGELQASAATTAGLLDEGKGSLATLAAAWGGQGSDAYQAVQTRWDEASLELNNALQNLAVTCETAADEMFRADQTNAGSFGG